MRKLISSGSAFEPRIGFSPDGGVAAPGDLYGQTKRCLEIIAQAIGKAGLGLDSVIRTRVMLTDISRWEEAARAHGEVFGRDQAGEHLRRGEGADPQGLAGGDRSRLRRRC